MSDESRGLQFVAGGSDGGNSAPNTSRARTTIHDSRPTGNVAIIHDWLTGMRGGEKVLEAICELYPEATLHTLVRVPGSVSRTIEARPIKTSFVQALPAAARLYRHYLPLFPTAVELIDLDRYDLVISSSHCAVKSVIPRGGAVHVCYCHSPMRYAWDQFGAYFGPAQVGRVTNRLLRPVMAGLARWDASTAGRVGAFLANSQYVARRIRRYYNRGSTVVYPPIDTEFYRPEAAARAAQPLPYFLVVSALVPYKRVDLAIEACRLADVPLKIVGHGPEYARLQQRAGPRCEFLGWRSDEAVRELYRSATAVLLPGVEDFGIVPVEAQACGRPVIALGAGGACESILDGETGILVDEPTPDAFADAVARIEQMDVDPEVIRANALRFSRERFLSSFQAAVAAARGDASRSTDRRRVSTLSGRYNSADRDNSTIERYNTADREDAARHVRDRSRLNTSSERYNTADREDEQ